MFILGIISLKKEIDYLISKYKTQVFNTHADLKNSWFAFLERRYRNLIYIENQKKIEGVFWEMTEKCAGVCLDISHWED